IARSSAVVTSRLHGLYNALNSGVPVAVIAWVFKYREALRQYNCEDLLVDLDNPVESLEKIVAVITDDASIGSIKAKMLSGRKRADELTEVMWREIKKLMP